MYRQRNSRIGHERDRREIPDRIVGELLEQELRARMRADLAHRQRIAIGRRFGADFRANDAACAGTVVDHHLLAPTLG
ncbi:hypothetical protein D3C83_36580 [compost metagenome]